MTLIDAEIRKYLKDWFIQYGTEITKRDILACDFCPLSGYKLIKIFNPFFVREGKCKSNFNFLMREENDDVRGCYNLVKKLIEKYYCNKSMNNE